MAKDLEPLKGAFGQSLIRTNKEIKKDRAASISEDAEMVYRRKVEDMKMQLKTLRRQRENMLDMSPTNTQSLILAGDFDASKFAEKDIAFGMQIRLLEIKVQEAERRYDYLFGGDPLEVTASPEDNSGDAAIMTE